MGRETYDFELELVYATPKAILVTDGISEQWLPRSQIFCASHTDIDDIEPGGALTVFMQEWLARKKGFV